MTILVRFKTTRRIKLFIITKTIRYSYKLQDIIHMLLIILKPPIQCSKIMKYTILKYFTVIFQKDETFHLKLCEKSTIQFRHVQYKTFDHQIGSSESFL